jgi:hypothetical protein
MRPLHIIMPMAGEGSRFKKEIPICTQNLSYLYFLFVTTYHISSTILIFLVIE